MKFIDQNCKYLYSQLTQYLIINVKQVTSDDLMSEHNPIKIRNYIYNKQGSFTINVIQKSPFLPPPPASSSVITTQPPLY